MFEELQKFMKEKGGFYSEKPVAEPKETEWLGTDFNKPKESRNPFQKTGPTPQRKFITKTEKQVQVCFRSQYMSFPSEDYYLEPKIVELKLEASQSYYRDSDLLKAFAEQSEITEEGWLQRVTSSNSRPWGKPIAITPALKNDPHLLEIQLNSDWSLQRMQIPWCALQFFRGDNADGEKVEDVKHFGHCNLIKNKDKSIKTCSLLIQLNDEKIPVISVGQKPHKTDLVQNPNLDINGTHIPTHGIFIVLSKKDKKFLRISRKTAINLALGVITLDMALIEPFYSPYQYEENPVWDISNVRDNWTGPVRLVPDHLNPYLAETSIKGRADVPF